jgi:hypothetical protein
MKIVLLTLILLCLEASSAAIESPNRSSSSSSASLHRNRRKTLAGRVTTIGGAPPGQRELSPKSSKAFASADFGTGDMYSLTSMSLLSSFSFAYAEPGSPLGPNTHDGEDTRNIFADIAKCAGVDMDAHGNNCAFEHVLVVMTGLMNNPAFVDEPV